MNVIVTLGSLYRQLGSFCFTLLHSRRSRRLRQGDLICLNGEHYVNNICNAPADAEKGSLMV